MKRDKLCLNDVCLGSVPITSALHSKADCAESVFGSLTKQTVNVRYWDVWEIAHYVAASVGEARNILRGFRRPAVGLF